MPETPSLSQRYHDDEALALFLRQCRTDDEQIEVYAHYRPLLVSHYLKHNSLVKHRIEIELYPKAWSTAIFLVRSKTKRVPFRSPLLLDIFYVFDILSSARTRFPPIDDWSPAQLYAAKKVLVKLLPKFKRVKEVLYRAFKEPTRASLRLIENSEFVQAYFEEAYTDAHSGLYHNPPRDRGKQEAKLFTYFKRIFRNKLADIYRRERLGNGPLVPLDTDALSELSEEDDSTNVSFEEYILSEVLQVDEDCREYLRKKLSQIGEECRKVLLLSYRDNYGYKEIAKELDIPIGTVSGKIKRCREALARILK